MAAPKLRRRPLPPGKPKMWINPCGAGMSQEHEKDNPPLETPTDMQVLQTIIVEADNGILAVDQFKFQFVEEVFQQSFEKHHFEWKDYQYDWLPMLQVPKTLGVLIDQAHLETIQLDEFMRDSYRYLQIMAVALEQVEWDHVVSGNTGFQKGFKNVQERLRLVLCEILTAMIERKVKPHPDVTRDVMKDEYRDMASETERNVRDWIIFRDYLIVMEYIRDVAKHFVENPSRIPPSS